MIRVRSFPSSPSKIVLFHFLFPPSYNLVSRRYLVCIGRVDGEALDAHLESDGAPPLPPFNSSVDACILDGRRGRVDDDNDDDNGNDNSNDNGKDVEEM